MNRPPRRLVALDQLAELKTALERNRRQAAELAAARERERRARDLFAETVGAVTPLAPSARTPPLAPRPAPEPLQRRRDEAAALRETLSDDFDVESLLETDAALSYRRPDIGPDVVKKLRRGGWVIQGEIDLHGLRRDEARDALATFVRDAERRGLRCVRVVHGKGHGSPGREPVLKHRVHGWLVQKAAVLAFTQARAAEGGSGALVVLLRPGNPG
jgi:DNA-nicking Smr family endonuclease